MMIGSVVKASKRDKQTYIYNISWDEKFHSSFYIMYEIVALDLGKVVLK